MYANLKDLDAWLRNPTPGAEQIINGQTPYERVKNLRKKVEQAVRGRQISSRTIVLEESAQEVEETVEGLREVLNATLALRKDLRRGKADPGEVLDKVGQSMHGLRVVAEDMQVIEASGRSADEMIDKDPADWQDHQQSRFPVGGRGPEITVAFLRGEEDIEIRMPGAGDE